jgi:nondiscriminating aspartyl-tRNA synthetase
LSSELVDLVGERVQLSGWLHHQRQLAQLSFLLLRDRVGIAQIVVSSSEGRSALAALAHETVLEVTGMVVRNEKAPAGVELHDPAFVMISESDSPLPFELRQPEIPALLPTLLDHAAVSLRHPRRRAAARLAAASTRGFRDTLDALDFTEIFTPKVVASATEGGANVFPIDWFGRTAYLAQSPQFYKQTMVGVFERVYEVAPVFRAEPHDTVRHLAEYVSLDVEMGFINDHRDVMALLRGVIAGMVDSISEHACDAAQTLSLKLPNVPSEIPYVDFGDAQQMIADSTGLTAVGEPDLDPSHERWLGEWAKREHGSDFLFVVGYPMVKRPFYTHPSPTDPSRSNSFDLLFRGLELVTGGQRRHRYEDYLIALEGTDLSAFSGYLEAFRFGMPPHGGFAIGLERWVARLTGASNIREAALFPRDLHRVTP